MYSEKHPLASPLCRVKRRTEVGWQNWALPWTFLFVILFTISQVQAQSSVVDSLRNAISQEVVDSLRVDLHLALSKVYLGSNLDSAHSEVNIALKLAEEIDYKKGMGYAHKAFGIIHYFNSEMVEALSEWNEASILFTEAKDSHGIANMYSNIGAVYYDQGNYNNAMDFYLKALELAEKIGDTTRMATSLQNIAAIEQNNKEIDNALHTFGRALKLFEITGYSKGAGLASVNMGDLHLEKGDYEEALELYLVASDYLDGGNYKSSAIMGIGRVYREREELDLCLQYFDSAYNLAVELVNHNIQVKALKYIAEVHQEKGDYVQAMQNYTRAADEMVSANLNIPELADVYEGLVTIHATLKNFEQAHFYQMKKEEVKDLLFDVESNKKFNRLLFNHELDKKENEIAILTKDKELQELTIGRQRFLRNLFVVGFLLLLIFALTFYVQRNKISKERQRSDQLLLNILPEEVAIELKEKGEAEARDHDEVSVLFTDFRSFTSISERVKPKELVKEMNYCFKAFDGICEKYSIEKIKTIGDSYMAVGGLPNPSEDSVVNTVLAALEMSKFILNRKNEREVEGKIPFEMRAGVHTGHVVAGIVGVKKFQYDVWGDTVNTASRMESHGEVGKVNISQATYKLLKAYSQFTFEHRGKVTAKGKGEVDMYFVSLT